MIAAKSKLLGSVGIGAGPSEPYTLWEGPFFPWPALDPPRWCAAASRFLLRFPMVDPVQLWPQEMQRELVLAHLDTQGSEESPGVSVLSSLSMVPED